MRNVFMFEDHEVDLDEVRKMGPGDSEYTARLYYKGVREPETEKIPQTRGQTPDVAYAKLYDQWRGGQQSTG